MEYSPQQNTKIFNYRNNVLINCILGRHGPKITVIGGSFEEMVKVG
jgi:hypothetical protein